MFRALVDILFGCRHPKTTRPITPVHKANTPAEETYVACLVCGKHLPYDLTTMRVGRAPKKSGKHSGADSILNSYR